MAVLAGGAVDVSRVYNQGDDNAADRLMALRAQIGDLDALVPGEGVIIRTKMASELVEIDVGIDVLDDGQTFGLGDRRLVTTVHTPFTEAMVGMSFEILGHGLRVIEDVISTSEIEYSGLAVAVGTGRRYTVPKGQAGFEHGEISAANKLTSDSASDEPFSAELVGHNVYMSNIGVREVATYIDARNITLAGDPITPQPVARYYAPVFREQSDQWLETSGGQVVDSHRVPETAAATTMRWQFGARRRRGVQRTVV